MCACIAAAETKTEKSFSDAISGFATLKVLADALPPGDPVHLEMANVKASLGKPLPGMQLYTDALAQFKDDSRRAVSTMLKTSVQGTSAPDSTEVKFIQDIKGSLFKLKQLSVWPDSPVHDREAMVVAEDVLEVVAGQRALGVQPDSLDEVVRAKTEVGKLLKVEVQVPRGRLPRPCARR